LVVGAAPTLVPPRTDRDISSSSSSRDPFVFALWKACLALSTLLYKGVASSSSSSSSFFFVSSTTFKSRTTKVFSRRLKRTQLWRRSSFLFESEEEEEEEEEEERRKKKEEERHARFSLGFEVFVETLNTTPRKKSLLFFGF
jgi:hypothetical protein